MIFVIFLQSTLEKLEIEIDTNMKLAQEDKQTVSNHFIIYSKGLAYDLACFTLTFCFSLTFLHVETALSFCHIMKS